MLLTRIDNKYKAYSSSQIKVYCFLICISKFAKKIIFITKFYASVG